MENKIETQAASSVEGTDSCIKEDKTNFFQRLLGNAKRKSLKKSKNNAQYKRSDFVPLTTKLVSVTLTMLVLGMFCVSFSIRQLVSSYLLQKTDTQLIDQAQTVYDSIGQMSQDSKPSNTFGPNDYFLQIRDNNHKVLYTPLIPKLRGTTVAIPDIPSTSIDSSKIGHPFTVSSVVTNADSEDETTKKTATAPWRVLILPWTMKNVVSSTESSSDDTDSTQRNNLTTSTVQSGYVYIALSLSDQIDTIHTLTRYCILAAVAVVMLGGVISALIIQQTLVPLKRIETTAAKIASGDLSQRVQQAPENTEVGSLAKSLNSMLSRIETSFKEQEKINAKMKRFVSDASHELRTPLAAIHGYAELYEMQRNMPGVEERADQAIDHIKTSSARMTELVEDLLSLARLDEGRGIDTSQEIEVSNIVSDACDDLHALDPERGISVGNLQLVTATGQQSAHFNFVADAMPLCTMKADATRLRQVITNIVGNIHRYTPNNTPVEFGLTVLPAAITPENLMQMPPSEQSYQEFLEAVEVGQTANFSTKYVIMQVRDHGPGVSQEDQSQIFERFYTADPSRARQKGGTGLGMAIAYSVVKAHQGIITATNTDGGGLTISVILPLL
ncbi:MAG: HAMP domain-containing sensor histidine kinase [Bifidobacteriaceae bacterium]|nr:HAMP domain-containing sensor histidine kinase [Bifidobacteriaceae bacterium]